MPEVGTIVRAFEIAREGSCQSLVDIRRQLHRENYQSIESHLSGALIKKQLSEILKAQT
ncbi:hypothetical protein [Sphingomonas sp. RB1R13]|uniref:hypothetical protein n=1 Tax=Sphingomonas sp. RB1R13 TaxID=3096159 RepID=UPI002FC5DFC1